MWPKFCEAILRFNSVLLMLQAVVAVQQGYGDELRIDLRHSEVAIISVKVADGVLPTIIDTGTTAVVVPPSFYETNLEHLSKNATDVQTVKGRRTLTEVGSVMCELAPFGKRESQVVVYAVPEEFERIIGRDFDGFCGMSLLDGRVLTISRTELLLRAPPRSQNESSTEYPLIIGKSRVPKCSIRFADSVALDFILDTGMLRAGCVHHRVAEHLERLGIALRVPVPGASDGRMLIVEELEFLGKIYRNVPMAIESANSIGMELLQLAEVTLDLHENKLFTTPRSQKAESMFCLDSSGLRFCFDEHDQARVRRIVKQTPAAETDIRVGDEFIAIDDVLLKDTTLLDAFHRLSAAGTTVKLDFKRDGKPYTVHLPLKRDFEYPPKWKAKEPDKKADDFFKFLQQNEPK